MELEEQVKKLSEIGLSLNEGITVDHLLLSFSREQYEAAPFDLILLAYGLEVEEKPWGRFICDQAWNFDVEAIEDNGSYVDIVNQFHRITGQAKRVDGLQDMVNIEESRAKLEYEVDGVKRSLEPVVDNDWADVQVVTTIMGDLSEDGYDFYPKDNGQSSVWFYLSDKKALALNNLANNVFNLSNKPWWKIW